MKTDIEISRSTDAKPIGDIAGKLGLTAEEWQPYGRHIAKVNLSVLDKPPRNKSSKLILVSAITPTPAGEGKTTTSIGLAQGFNHDRDPSSTDRLTQLTPSCPRRPRIAPKAGARRRGAVRRPIRLSFPRPLFSRLSQPEGAEGELRWQSNGR